MLQLAYSLDFCHGKGVAHRDGKSAQLEIFLLMHSFALQ